MKKITFLLSFVACIAFTNAQTNLLVNPGFETWAAGVPTGWTFEKTTGTLTQSNVTPTNSGSSLQVAATATYWITQNVPAPVGGFDLTKKYKVSFKYKSNAGDGTDARIWSNWMTSPIGATTGVYPGMTLTDSLGLKGPGGNNAPTVLGNGSNGYLIDNRSGVWESYSFSFTPIAGATQFSFQLRVYTAATVLWDDVYFGIDAASGLSTPKASTLEVLVSGKNLLVKNVVEGSPVEIFSAVGSKVQTSAVENGKVSIANLKGGMYVVRSGKLTQKSML
jgi:hypothetical protein